MNRFPQLANLVHENLSIVMCFAYSRRPLEQMMASNFVGRFRYLERALFYVSEERAIKALMELALFLRTLDDDEGISDYHAAIETTPNCGVVINKDGSEETLTFRFATNKIIHSSRIEWEFSKVPAPIVVCHSRGSEKWLRAEINLISIAAVCGQLAS